SKALQLVVGVEHATFEFVNAESVPFLETASLVDELFGGTDLAATGRRIGIPEEQVRRERHLITYPPAQQLRHRDTEVLSDEVETGELDRGKQLSPIVVEARCRIGDRESQRLEHQRIMADQVLLERDDGCF